MMGPGSQPKHFPENRFEYYATYVGISVPGTDGLPYFSRRADCGCCDAWLIN
jgi:hypothetical protein